MPRPMDPLTLKIRELLDAKGDIPFSEAIQHLEGVERRKFDAAKMGWKAGKTAKPRKSNKKKAAVKASKKAAKRTALVQTPPADLRRVASAPLSDSLSFVKNHGGLAKLEGFIKEAQQHVEGFKTLKRQMDESV
jgi:hypothetical protein